MVQNETGITRLFYDALRASAEASGMQFQSFPLGGQDRKVLSDELLATLDNFALVEMKHSEVQLKTERKKYDRVLRLCKALEANPDMRKLHDACHWVAYKDSQSKRIVSSPYRHQICNRQIFPGSKLQADSPSDEDLVPVNTFGNRFLGKNQPPIGQHTDDFNKYLSWLLETVTAQEGQPLHVIVSESDAQGELIAVEFSSLKEINEWLSQIPKPTETSTNIYQKPSGP